MTMIFKIFMLLLPFVNCDKLKLLAIEECAVDNPQADDILTVTSELVEIDGEKAFNGKISLNTDFDYSFTYTASITNQDQTYKYSIRGDLCTHLNIFMPGLWRKITQAAGVTNQCPISPGEYEVNNFMISTEECGFPFYLPGIYIVTANIFKDNIPVVCHQFTVEGLYD